MVSTRINIQALSAFMKEARDSHEAFVDAGLATWPEYRKYLTIDMKGERHRWQPQADAAERTIDDLAFDLRMASLSLGEFGASKKQISLILQLSAELDDFRELGCFTLDRQDASKIINGLQRQIEARDAS